jgi:hypothetical protein
MFLDAKTIIVALILTCWLMILAQIGAYAGKFRDGVGKWTMGLLLISLANVFILVRGIIPVPLFLSIIISNVLLATGNSFGYAAVCEFIHRRANPLILFGPPFALAVAVLIISESVPGRTFALGFIIGMQDVAIVYLILRDSIIQSYRMRWLLFAGFMSGVFIYLGRALGAILLPEDFQIILSGNIVNAITLFFGFFSLILISLGFILLSREKIDMQNQRTAAELKERIRLTTLAAEISRTMVTDLSLQEILKHCTDFLVQHLEMALARTWILNRIWNCKTKQWIY